ncbi:MAG TPA: CHRD domain-containing protein [Steroidobacteraceae bacterium]|nr:CHRD domain-containing protein [Steroidobacteraceae bacterium]
MKKHLVGITSAIMLLCFGTAMADHDIDLRAHLRGLNEVPPTASRATAELRAEISPDESSISFTLSFENLTANAAAAHIHFGPSKVTGGVMVFFCGGGGKPACPAATSGTVTGTITAADIVGPAAQGIPAAPNGKFADVVRAIKTGNGYANIHTANFPGGEVRGQVVVVGFGDHDDDDK